MITSSIYIATFPHVQLGMKGLSLGRKTRCEISPLYLVVVRHSGATRVTGGVIDLHQWVQEVTLYTREYFHKLKCHDFSLSKLV